MALSTVKIADTIEYCKKLSFNRSPVIGNNLEPALTAAQSVMDVILGPPFDYWWNNQELAFTCNTTPLVSSAITNVVVTANELTLTVNNSFAAGALVLVSGLVTATWLNGQLLVLDSATPTQVTAPVSRTTYVSAADTVGILTAQTTQDYTLSTPNFSHIEHASVLDTSSKTPKWWELKVQNNLALDSTLARPAFIGPHVEDGNGNVTFRVMPAPVGNYPVSLHVQLAPPRITSVNQTWAPIPDFMQSIYTWGFLALMWAFADDPRFQIANSKFTAGLLARAEGITEEERNIFLNNWNDLTGGQMMKMQQGNQMRGV